VARAKSIGSRFKCVSSQLTMLGGTLRVNAIGTMDR